MGFLKSTGMLALVRRMMPWAFVCPVMPGRSEILLAALLVLYLAVELVAPIAVQIVCAALFVPLGIAVVVSRRSLRTDKDIPAPSPCVASFASRAPPVS